MAKIDNITNKDSEVSSTSEFDVVETSNNEVEAVEGDTEVVENETEVVESDTEVVEVKKDTKKRKKVSDKKLKIRIKEFCARHGVIRGVAKVALVLLIVYVAVITASFIVMHSTEKSLVKAYLDIPATAPKGCGFTIDEMTTDKLDSLLASYAAEAGNENVMTIDEMLDDIFGALDEQIGIGDKYKRSDVIDICSYIKNSYEGVKDFFKNEDGTYYIGEDWLVSTITAYTNKVLNVGLVLRAENTVNFLYEEAVPDGAYSVEEKGLYQDSFLELRGEYNGLVTNADVISTLNNIYDKMYRVVETGYNKLYNNIAYSGINSLDEATRRSMVLPCSDNTTYQFTFINEETTENSAGVDEALENKELANNFASIVGLIHPFDDLYAAVETNAYLSALKDSKNKLTDSQIGFFKERIDKDFWFWRYIAGETVDDENYVAVIDSSIMNNELVVIPAYVNIPEEDKRCCWITAQEAILEELGTLATTGLSSEVVDADTKHDKAYYEDVVTGAYTLYMAYMQHANVVMTSL